MTEKRCRSVFPTWKTTDERGCSGIRFYICQLARDHTGEHEGRDAEGTVMKWK